MLFILLFIVMCLLDKKFDTYVFFKTIGMSVLTFVLLLIGGSLAKSNAIQSEIPIHSDTFISSSFTRSSSGKQFFVYSNEKGTFSVPVIRLKMKEGTKNQVNTYLTTYPKIYKYLFFTNDKKYYIVENKPWQRLFSLL